MLPVALSPGKNSSLHSFCKYKCNLILSLALRGVFFKVFKDISLDTSLFLVAVFLELSKLLGS